jgi:HPr kinase/phosphorylase
VASLQSVSVGVLLRSRTESFGLPLDLLAGGDGLTRAITSPHIQKTGLALAGFHEFLKPGRILIFGESEIRFLESLAPAARSTALRLALTHDVPCVVVTGGFATPPELAVEAERAGLPLLRTPVPTPTAIAKLSSILEDSLAERTMMHAVLMDILGLGVLIVGESGIGKSECALDLVIRGHRLVADDVIHIKKKMPAALVGQAGESIQHHMEIRGLGIINIKDLYGVSSIREKKIIDMVLELVEWDADQEYERLGIDDQVKTILGVDLPHLKIPVRPGRNLTSIIEVAARNFLLKGMGYHSAREFHEKLLARMEFRPLGNEVE